MAAGMPRREAKRCGSDGPRWTPTPHPTHRDEISHVHDLLEVLLFCGRGLALRRQQLLRRRWHGGPREVACSLAAKVPAARVGAGRLLRRRKVGGELSVHRGAPLSLAEGLDDVRGDPAAAAAASADAARGARSRMRACPERRARGGVLGVRDERNRVGVRRRPFELEGRDWARRPGNRGGLHRNTGVLRPEALQGGERAGCDGSFQRHSVRRPQERRGGSWHRRQGGRTGDSVARPRNEQNEGSGRRGRLEGRSARENVVHWFHASSDREHSEPSRLSPKVYNTSKVNNPPNVEFSFTARGLPGLHPWPAPLV